jgi:hypothetical protein
VRIRRTSDRFVATLGQRETSVFLTVLRLYPRIPPAHQRLSKSGQLPDAEVNQQLLDDALAEQRTQTREQLQSLLSDPKRFLPNARGSRLRLTPEELEWLLQVFNDIRVGSWVLLGSPEDKLEAALADPETARLFWDMEMAGHFQMQLLAALEGRAEDE